MPQNRFFADGRASLGLLRMTAEGEPFLVWCSDRRMSASNSGHLARPVGVKTDIVLQNSSFTAGVCLLEMDNED